MKRPKRRFTGIWIPRTLWESQEFSTTEKFLLLEINSLDTADGCWATNKFLAEFLQCSPGHVANLISKLKRQGALVEQEADVENEGKKRRKLSLSPALQLLLDPQLNSDQALLSESATNTDLQKKMNVPSEKNEHRFLYKYKNINNKNNNTVKVNSNDVIVVLDFWNNCKTSALWRTHRKLTKDMEDGIRKALTDYSLEQISPAILGQVSRILGTILLELIY